MRVLWSHLVFYISLLCKKRNCNFLYITYTMLRDVNIPHRSCTSDECTHCDCIHLRHGRWQDWSRSTEESSYLYATRRRIYIRRSRYEEVSRAATFRNFWTCNHLQEKLSLYLFLFIYLHFALSIISFQLLFIRCLDCV